ncbi:MAG: DMT family transporter [Candidatus Dormibacteraeota bacterium]|nr:DMT family transporter [Candidatus Dormibacteraeota bacterium]
MSRRGWLLFGIVGLGWGIPYLLIKLAVGSFSPATVVFLRCTIGALVLLPLTAVRGELAPVLRAWRWLLLLTIIEIAGPWWLLTDAERRLTSSLAGLLIAAMPLVGALLAWVTGADERVDARRLGGTLVGIAGVAVLVGFDVGGSDLGAAGEIALVVIGYAIGPFIIARRLTGLSGTAVVAVALTVTALVYAGLAAVQLPRSAPAGSAVAAAVVLGLVCTAFAFPVFFALIREVGPVRATVVTYVNPAVAVLAGVIFLREPFTASTATGFALIVAGSFLATRRSRSIESTLRVGRAAPGVRAQPYEASE